MTNSILIKIDLSGGLLEVSASPEELEQVFEKVLAVLPRLSNLPHKSHKIDPLDNAASDAEPQKPKTAGQAKKQTKRSSSKRVAFPGQSDEENKKLGTPFYKDFQTFDLGIGDENEVKAAKTYTDKAPASNSDKALVSLYLLEQFGKKHSSYPDIFQMLRIVGEKSPPKNMSSTVAALLDSHFAAKEANGIRIKIQGTDHVEKMGPKSD